MTVQDWANTTQLNDSSDSGVGDSGSENGYTVRPARSEKHGNWKESYLGHWTTEQLEDFPEELMSVFEGVDVYGDSGSPQDSKPPWFDEELFRAGQECFQEHLFGLAFSQLMGLFVMFSFPGGTDPLVATGGSDTPFAASRRYLNTNLRISSWATGDPFDPRSECRKNLVIVRRKHEAVRAMLNSATPEELAVLYTIGKDSTEPGTQNLWCPLAASLRANLEGPSCPAIKISIDRFDRPILSQFEMSFTQFSFFGMFLVQPHLYGAHYISERSLEGLVHMWAVLGYCLGIMDRYNYCLGGLDIVRRRCQLTLDLVVRPNLHNVPAEWEHMGRCVVAGLRMFMGASSYETSLSYLMEDVFGLDVPVLKKSMTFMQRVELFLVRFLMQTLTRIFPSLNAYFSARLARAMERAKKLPADRLQQMASRRFSYQRIFNQGVQ